MSSTYPPLLCIGVANQLGVGVFAGAAPAARAFAIARKE
jgi:hypothetical protein